jgi:hypothetical protein
LTFGNTFGGNASPVLNLTIPGTYLLTVKGATSSNTGSYTFRLSDLASATPITPGTPVSTSLSPGNSTNVYQFNANAGDPFYFDVLSGGGSPNTWRLMDPYGRQLFYNYFGNQYSGPLTMPSTGTYTLLFEGYIGNTSPVNYTFNVVKDTNTTTALTLGSQVNDVVSQAGQLNYYTFTFANPSKLYFDSLTNDGTVYWTPGRPAGHRGRPTRRTGQCAKLQQL